MKNIFVGLALILSSCGMQELKKLNTETQEEINSIVSELKLEDFDYGNYTKLIDGKNQNYFKVRLSNIDDTTNLESYNLRIIEAFNKSDYNLNQYNFVAFYYYKNYKSGDLFRFYKVRANDGEILEESQEVKL